MSGSVIAALIVGCCVGVLADWRLREKGPPIPARAKEPVLSSSPSRESITPAPAVIRAETPEEQLVRRDLRFPIDRMDIDRLKAPALYFGTTTGQLWIGREGGEQWDCLFDSLPPIHNVKVAVV